jgi:hypothetical protein
MPVRQLRKREDVESISARLAEFTTLRSGSTSAHEVHHEQYDCEREKYMDEPYGYMKGNETEQPSNQQNKGENS